MIFLWSAVAERSGDTALNCLEYRLQAALFGDNTLRLKAGLQTKARSLLRSAGARQRTASLLLRLFLIRCWFFLGNLNLGAIRQRVIAFNHHRLAALQAGSNFHFVFGANSHGHFGLVRD